MNDFQIIILAAGKGSRMMSAKPKVLQQLAGKTLLQHIVDSAWQITKDITIIYGFGAELVKNSINQEINWIYQDKQNGTASAIKLALSHIDKNKTTLILYADVPLISVKTIKKLLNNKPLNLLTAKLENPYGYGRILRNNNKIIDIVEQKDASEKEQNIQEINTGIMALSGELLHKYLPQINNNNAQQEYYLTDIIKIAVNDNIPINSITTKNLLEISGVNDKKQLADLERNYQISQAEQFMLDGLTISDKNRFDNRGNLSFANDCSVDINTIFNGDNKLGSNVEIGAFSIITNSVIGDNSKILPHSIIENAVIGENVIVGPFARIRPQTVIERNAKIGNFVEIKKSNIGASSKVNHLSYIGDSDLGSNINIGAGTITCNYDGNNKHNTIIGDNTFIGSNTALIAPIKIGKNVIIGAGSTITKDVADDTLGIERNKQKNIKRK